VRHLEFVGDGGDRGVRRRAEAADVGEHAVVGELTEVRLGRRGVGRVVEVVERHLAREPVAELEAARGVPRLEVADETRDGAQPRVGGGPRERRRHPESQHVVGDAGAHLLLDLLGLLGRGAAGEERRREGEGEDAGDPARPRRHERSRF